MALEEVVLPKEYKNARILFEQNLDKWRVKAQQSFNVTNLNLAQIAKDCFLPGYDYDNDGQANYGLSLEARLNSIISGGAILTGTAYPSWTINSAANSATMTTSILTAPRTYQFPDVSGTFLLNYATQPGNAIRVNQDIISGGSPFLFHLQGGAHTGLAASTEASDIIFDLARTVTFATGNIVTQRALRVSAPTYAFAAASTITDASTFYISGAPIAGANATFTNAYALLVAAGQSRFQGNVWIGGNLSLSGSVITDLNVDLNILWKSSTAFTGTLDHANTANRVYTYPDATGNIPSLPTAATTETGIGAIARQNSPTFTGEVGLADVDPPTANKLNRNGVVKGWIYASTGPGAGVITIHSSYNCTATENGFGARLRIAWDTDFANTDYVFSCVVNATIATLKQASPLLTFKSASILELEARTQDGTDAGVVPNNAEWYVIAIGDQ